MADADLQNYAGTPVWNDDLTAASTLLPVDGKKITADNNAAGRAPVNRSLKQLKQMLIGVHDGIFGSRSGSTRRTLKSLEVDGTGGAASTIPAGDIKALGNVTAAAGDLLAPAGAVTAAGIVQSTGGSLVSQVADLIAAATTSLVRIGLSPAQRVEIGNHVLRFLATGTGGADANPPQGTSIKNQLRAKNLVKANAFIEMQAANVISSFDGNGVATAVISGGTAIKITFVDAFADTRYSITTSDVYQAAGVRYEIQELTYLRTTTECFFAALSSAGSVVDFTATPVSFSFTVVGKQTT